MNRLVPSLALLVLVASRTDVSACGGWCSRFFAGVFGSQPAVQATNQPAAPTTTENEVLLELELTRLVDPPPASLPAIAVAPATLLEPERSHAVHPWGTLEVERVFEFAYGPFLFDFGQRRQLIDRWLPTIGNRVQAGNVSTFDFWMSDDQHVLRYGIQALLDPSGSLMVSIREPPLGSDFYARSAREFGLPVDDSIFGLWGRMYQAMPGRGGVHSIQLQFDNLNWNDLGNFERHVETHDFLEAANLTPSGQFIDRFYGMSARLVRQRTFGAGLYVVFERHQASEQDFPGSLDRGLDHPEASDAKGSTPDGSEESSGQSDNEEKDESERRLMMDDESR